MNYFTSSPTLRSRPTAIPSSLGHSSPGLPLPTPSTSTLKRRHHRPTPLSQRLLSLLSPRRLAPYLLLLLLVSVGLLAKSSTRDLLVLARFKLHDALFTDQWIPLCRVRKKPVLFIHDEGRMALVWETNCGCAKVNVKWGEIDGFGRPVGQWKNSGLAECRDAEEGQQLGQKSATHWVYSAKFDNLVPRVSYGYSLSSSPSSISPFSLPSDSLSSSSNSTKLSFLAVSDNQYNLRVFHRLLVSFASSSVSTLSFLLHAGDVVQNPHNLKQWQTDFWDPLVSSRVLVGQGKKEAVPILLARGNHDFDRTGVNVYTGGIPRPGSESRGTYYAYSPHTRVRIIVLDSNLVEVEELEEQERWLVDQFGRREWTEASVKIVVVHVPPFLEYWDREAWEEKGENQWSSYVRLRLTPLLSHHRTTLVISGHQHAYSRGFLPSSLIVPFTTTPNSSSLPTSHFLAWATVNERGWEKSRRPTQLSSSLSEGTDDQIERVEDEEEEGTVYTIIGGAGGTLDEDKVEEWGFYETSFTGEYFFVRVEMEFGVPNLELEEKKEGRVYWVRRKRRCVEGERVVWDRLRWEVVGIDGRTVLDRFEIVAEACE